MPTGARRPNVVLLDTSVSVALVVEDHVAHDVVLRALRGRRLGLAGHAYFETYSVLTRLPGPARRSVADVMRLLEHNFPETHFLGADQARALARRLDELGIAGGAVYDALVGAAAAEHDLALATRDERALDTYRALAIDIRFIA
jgi:predicted nucleic acid-binding protein